MKFNSSTIFVILVLCYFVHGERLKRQTQTNATVNVGNDSPVRMETRNKVIFQRESTGPVAVSEVDPEGKFIVLENMSSGPRKQDANLDGWKLTRTVDEMRDYTYNFRNYVLKPGKKVKIFAQGSASDAGLNDLTFREETNWGVGSKATTLLTNNKGEEKARHVQKTLYSQTG